MKKSRKKFLGIGLQLYIVFSSDSPKKPRSKTERRRTNNWAFYQLRLFTEYKAAIAGVPVVLVPPAYTSQTCSRCHHVHPIKGKSYRSGKSFKCGHCGFEADSDWNASLNIAVLGLSVIQPESPGMSCLLEGQLSLFPTNALNWAKAPSMRERGSLHENHIGVN